MFAKLHYSIRRDDGIQESREDRVHSAKTEEAETFKARVMEVAWTKPATNNVQVRFFGPREIRDMKENIYPNR